MKGSLVWITDNARATEIAGRSPICIPFRWGRHDT